VVVVVVVVVVAMATATATATLAIAVIVASTRLVTITTPASTLNTQPTLASCSLGYQYLRPCRSPTQQACP
jgi:hypothetical protein